MKIAKSWALYAATMSFAAICAASVQADASPVTTFDSSVASWDVGTGQLNDHFAVTTDNAFAGQSLELGLRAEQRSVGGVTPTAGTADYVVQTGTDTTQPNASRAWWNFHLATKFSGGIANLSGLTLEIVRDAGTNGDGGIFDLLPLYALINDDNTPSADSYLIDQNPVFGWFDPLYDLSSSDPFAYRFLLTASATGVDGISTVTAQMCVHTVGASCAAAADVPEPSSLWIITGLLALMSMFGFGLIGRRQISR